MKNNAKVHNIRNVCANTSLTKNEECVHAMLTMKLANLPRVRF
jgi:hypothetical protein